MHIITRKRILEAIEAHPDCETSLNGWYRVMKETRFQNFAELRNSFGAVDKVGRVYVFNVAGNKLRLIVAIHLNTGKVFIRSILTHAEYDEDKWKE